MPNIKHLVNIKSSSDKIFEAISTVEGLSQWWTPQTTGSSKVGGELKFGFGPDYYKLMQVESSNENMIKWTCTEAVDEWVGTSIVFKIDEEQEKSILRFWHNDWQQYSDMYAQCSFDWALFLRSLKIYCETGTGCPFPNHSKY